MRHLSGVLHHIRSRCAHITCASLSEAAEHSNRLSRSPNSGLLVSDLPRVTIQQDISQPTAHCRLFCASPKKGDVQPEKEQTACQSSDSGRVAEASQETSRAGDSASDSHKENSGSAAKSEHQIVQQPDDGKGKGSQEVATEVCSNELRTLHNM